MLEHKIWIPAAELKLRLGTSAICFDNKNDKDKDNDDDKYIYRKPTNDDPSF